LFTHDQSKAFKCNKCTKSFGTNAHLKRHQFVHTDEKPFKCSNCGKSYKVKSDLRQHELKIHKK
jgi:KRAB domain-containing zinc finger protein